MRVTRLTTKVSPPPSTFDHHFLPATPHPPPPSPRYFATNLQRLSVQQPPQPPPSHTTHKRANEQTNVHMHICMHITLTMHTHVTIHMHVTIHAHAFTHPRKSLSWHPNARSKVETARPPSTTSHFLIPNSQSSIPQDGNGWTALHYAAFGGKQTLSALVLLIDLGADLDIKNRNGETQHQHQQQHHQHHHKNPLNSIHSPNPSTPSPTNPLACPPKSKLKERVFWVWSSVLRVSY